MKLTLATAAGSMVIAAPNPGLPRGTYAQKSRTTGGLRGIPGPRTVPWGMGMGMDVEVEMDGKSIADCIKEEICELNLTAYALGKMTGVSPVTIQRFLAGERGLTLATAEKLTRASAWGSVGARRRMPRPRTRMARRTRAGRGAPLLRPRPQRRDPHRRRRAHPDGEHQQGHRSDFDRSPPRSHGLARGAVRAEGRGCREGLCSSWHTKASGTKWTGRLNSRFLVLYAGILALYAGTMRCMLSGADGSEPSKHHMEEPRCAAHQDPPPSQSQSTLHRKRLPTPPEGTCASG